MPGVGMSGWLHAHNLCLETLSPWRDPAHQSCAAIVEALGGEVGDGRMANKFRLMPFSYMQGARWYTMPAYTTNLSYASRLIEQVLPGWWWKCGTSHLSDDACIGPDLSDPKNGQGWVKTIGEFDKGSAWDEGFDTVRSPSGNPASALMASFCLAMHALEQKGWQP